jgi:hypothetical protein
MSTTASPRTDAALPRLVAPHFPQAEAWHESVPAEISQAAGWDDGDAGWRAWRRHLERRKTTPGIKALWRAATPPLLWSLPGGLEADDAPAAVAEIHQWAREAGDTQHLADALRTWLEQAGDGPPDAGFALLCLAWAHALPRAARRASAASWWDALGLLTRVAEDAAAARVDHDPLLHQWMAGELPLTLARLYPELEPCRALESTARRALSTGVEQLLGDDGLPRGRWLPSARPLWACWTRARLLGTEPGLFVWDDVAERRYRAIFSQMARLSRKDGSQALVHGAAGAWRPELFEAALKLAGRAVDRRVAARALPVDRSGSIEPPDHLPSPAAHDKTARLGILRRDWSPGSEALTVEYDGPRVLLELRAGRDVLSSGEWGLDLRVEGEPATLADNWDEVCWVSDDDVDYLELEAEFTGGVRVQRQMLLARQDRFLLLADAVLGSEPWRIDYRGTLPLRPGVSFRPADDTREGWLTGRKPRATVLPLALPEWRGDPRGGALAWHDAGLELTQTGAGPSLFAPLWIDLDPRRQDCPLTWRQLTVAELRENVRPSVAAGYRVQIGKRQWLVYRSLTGAANRSVMGSNLASQFLLARFTRKGQTRELLEVE